MKNVLILGINGMLGSMVKLYFEKKKRLKVFKTNYTPVENELNCSYLDASNINIKVELINLFKRTNPDYIINCIGIIKPYCKDDDMIGVLKAIQINSIFPHILSISAKMHDPNLKIIQIATDCVYDGTKGKYNENDFHDALDVYGKTKSLGEVIDDNFLNVRCSIIGPEISNKLSLMEWFLGKADGEKVYGFTHHLWNGVTTLQFAEFCDELIMEEKFNDIRNLNHTIHYVKNETVSKKTLLEIINHIFNRKIIIEPNNSIGEAIDRSLSSIWFKKQSEPMENAILKLKQFMDENYKY